MLELKIIFKISFVKILITTIQLSRTMYGVVLYLTAYCMQEVTISCRIMLDMLIYHSSPYVHNKFQYDLFIDFSQMCH